MSAPPPGPVVALVAAVAVSAAVALGVEVLRARRNRAGTSRMRTLGRRPPVPGRRPDGAGVAGPGRAGRRTGRVWRWAPALVAGAVLVPVSLPAAAVVGAAVATVPALRARAERRRQLAVLIDEVPDVIDLCRIAVDAGCTVRLALVTVVDHGQGHLVDALAGVLADVARGRRLAPALDALRPLGEPVRPLLDALLAAERYGAPLAPGLERAAIEARSRRRRRGEEAARRVPVAMLFPLVLCTLPALVLLTVVPLLARSLPALAP